MTSAPGRAIIGIGSKVRSEGSTAKEALHADGIPPRRYATSEIRAIGLRHSGGIPGFQGVYASASTLEACREQLSEVLEGWVVLGLRLNHALAIVDGISLAIEWEVA